MHAARSRAARIRSPLAGAALFLAAAAFTLWQNTRVAALFDLSYLLDGAWRFSLGQLPYRNIPFAHAPGTFLLHAAIIHIFGRVYYPHLLCATLESGVATLLAWRILLHLLKPLGDRAWWPATLLAATLVPLGIYSIYPHPIYDSDCILAVLFALYLLQRAMQSWDEADAEIAGGSTIMHNAVAGAACVLPLFFKQNIGLPFLAVAIFGGAVITALRLSRHQPIAPLLCLLGGTLAAILAALLAIHLTVGLASYRYWTITFAAQRRLPGFADIVAIYRQPSLLWTIPAAVAGLALLRLRDRRWPRAAAFLLLAAPFLWTIAQIALSTDPEDRAAQLLSLWPHVLVLATALALASLWRFARGISPSAAALLLPILILAAIHGAFLSQQLWGSTYAIWPLLVFLIAMLILQAPRLALPLAATIAATLLLCGGLYAASLERMSYLNMDGSQTRATLPALRGMTTPGPWLPQFEEMVHFTASEIPSGDGILLVPGEDPFYFATGRTPQFPILLFDRATDPYTPQQTADLARSRNIRWLIIKRNLQLMAPPDYETPELLRTLQQDFVPYRALTGYDVYRRP